MLMYMNKSTLKSMLDRSQKLRDSYKRAKTNEERQKIANKTTLFKTFNKKQNINTVLKKEKAMQDTKKIKRDLENKMKKAKTKEDINKYKPLINMANRILKGN